MLYANPQDIHGAPAALFIQAASCRRRRVSAPRTLASCNLFLRRSTACSTEMARGKVLPYRHIQILIS